MQEPRPETSRAPAFWPIAHKPESWWRSNISTRDRHSEWLRGYLSPRTASQDPVLMSSFSQRAQLAHGPSVALVFATNECGVANLKPTAKLSNSRVNGAIVDFSTTSTR